MFDAGITITGQYVSQVSGSANVFSHEAYDSSSVFNSANFNVRRGRGTAASPTAVQTSDRIGGFVWSGQRSTTPADFNNCAAMYGFAAENFDLTHGGAYFIFEVAATGATARGEVARHGPGNHIYYPRADTSASAANAFLDSSSSPANELLSSYSW